MWYLAEIIGPIQFEYGLVKYGKCLISLGKSIVNVWLYPSNGRVSLTLDVARRVLKTCRDGNNRPIKWQGGVG